MAASATIGIIGGTGLYSIVDSKEEIEVNTKYGKPSSPITIGKIGDKKVAFIARHGKEHTITPHMVPYRANIAALGDMGVTRILSSNAVGSLNSAYKPGDFVLFDQFVNMTQGRKDTFFDENEVVHVGMADPYCTQMRAVASECAHANKEMVCHDRGTVVVINGPRFSTRAESKLFMSQGFEVINMTQYPEIALAREKKMCYLGIGLVTDFDVGLASIGNIKPVSFDEVKRVFNLGMEKMTALINQAVQRLPDERNCACQSETEV
ncbi:MAG: S-methyl-5'-thioadenosine phosphorylase [Candidatus Micrarchaeota archaeon]|nr:S-methyl-5'-thioadenosine phosphorylase [Candidatus Micrarchaeota archaeon]